MRVSVSRTKMMFHHEALMGATRNQVLSGALRVAGFYFVVDGAALVDDGQESNSSRCVRC